MNTILQGLWNRMRRRYGVYHLLSLALLLSSLLLGAWAVDLHTRAEALGAAISAKRVAQSKASQVPRRRVPLAEQVNAFVDGIPPLDTNANDVERLFQSARQHNVQLPRGDYKFKQEPGEPLASYSATFPVKAEYGALRDFSADVLDNVPHASMEELRMTRSSADSKVLEAVIRFTFVYRR
jgi:hypothetical protein